MNFSQLQINMMFGSAPESALNYINYLGANLDYDLVTNSVINNVNGFRIANLARLDVAQDILGAFRKAASEGKSDKWFVDYLTPTLKAKGWWHSEELINPDTGEIIDNILDTEIGSPARLKLIYENLCNTMYAVSHYIRMRNVSALYPYWGYHAIDDSHTREEHAKLRNKVFRFDDPIWRIIYPPNGHRCRCSIDSYSDEDIKRLGITVLSSTEIINEEGRRGVSFVDENGATVRFFPDAGFDYNPAEAYYEIDLNRYELELAQRYADAELSGPQLEKMYQDAVNGELTKENITAAVLSDEDMKAWGMESNVIHLPQSTLSTQMQNETLPPLSTLQQLQSNIIKAPVILNYHGALCFCEFDGVNWRLVGISTAGEVRMIANLTDDAFQLIAEKSVIIRGLS